MNTNSPESEPLLQQVLRFGLASVATAGAGSTLTGGFDDLFAKAQPVDVTGLHGAQIDGGSVMHHGPEEGGAPLDRPSAGYLAHASASNGVEIERGPDVSTIARNIDKAGTFTYDGQAISVLEYVPGGDLVRMAAGNVDPAQVMMMLAHAGLQSDMQKEKHVLDGGAAADSAPQAPDSQESSTRFEQDDCDIGNAGPVENGDEPLAASQPERDGNGNIVPDADQNARDLEALALKHRLDLDTVVETSDQASVQTRIHAHGRTLEIKTDFEAVAPDNELERAEAANHIDEAARSPLSENEHTLPGMHFRSLVQAHLAKSSQDDGIGI